MPIQKIKFPSQPGQTATNRIRVEIDVANRDVVLSSGAVGCETWAVAIDWVGAKYQATSPVVLVHGIRSSGAVWGPFREGLTAARVESDASINLADVAAPSPLPVGCPNIPYNNTSRTTSASCSRGSPRSPPLRHRQHPASRCTARAASTRAGLPLAPAPCRSR